MEDLTKKKENSLWQKVIEDIKVREDKGYNTYGKYVTAYGPENFLQEAYEEALDQTIYLRAALEKSKLEESKRSNKMAYNNYEYLYPASSYYGYVYPCSPPDSKYLREIKKQLEESLEKGSILTLPNTTTYAIKLNVYDYRNGEKTLVFFVPGVSKEELFLSISKNTLLLKVVRKEDKYKNCLKQMENMDTGVVSYSRAYQLKEGEKVVSHSHENGTVVVKIKLEPKQEDKVVNLPL